MSTLAEIKSAASSLSIDDQLELAKWIRESDAVRAREIEALRRDLDAGIADIDRGHFTECKGDDELAAFMDRIKSEGRKNLAQKVGSAA